MKALSRFLGLTFAGFVATAPPVSASDTYKIDTAHSTISFSVHQFINVTHGKFKEFSGTIEVDREHPDKSSVTATIPVRGIDTNIKKRDDHLRSAEFFDAAKYPEITFKSRQVKQTGPQSGDIEGDFTMHGVTRPITLHVKLVSPLKDDMPRSRWEATTDPINRREFSLMFSSGAEAISGISQQVAIKIDIEAVRAR